MNNVDTHIVLTHMVDNYVVNKLSNYDVDKFSDYDIEDFL